MFKERLIKVENPVYDDPSFTADASHYQDLNPSKNIDVDKMYTDYDYTKLSKKSYFSIL